MAKISKIVVTGATGFLGSRICNYFRNGVGNPHSIEDKAEMSYEVCSPAHIELEITDRDKVENFFREKRPDILIHCAAISDVGKCEEDVEASYRINVTGVENLARVCAEYGTKMVFCSSDQIYFSKEDKAESRNAEQMSVPHKETDIVMPCNTYGRQKLEAEKRTLAVCPEAVCLRLTWMYDTVQMLPQEHGNFHRNVKEALERGETCSFPTHDVRGITYVGSVIENLPRAFSLPGGVYNYGAENRLNTYELVSALFEKIGIAQQYIKPNEQAFAENHRNISMDMSKIRAYGIEFEDTLDKLVKEWGNQKEKSDGDVCK